MTAHPGSVGRGALWALLALLVLAAALRVWGLARFPFEEDELYTEIGARELLDAPVGAIKGRPLYFLIQHPLLPALPRGPVSLRLLPFLFGVAGVWATFHLAEVMIGRRAAWTAGLIATLSPWHLHISGTARYWSLVYLLSALACLLLVRAYARDDARGYLAALTVLTLGSATHPTFIFPMIGVALALGFVHGEKTRWRWPTRRAWTHLWVPYLILLGLAFAVLKLTGNESALRNFQGRGLAANVRLLPAIVEWITPIVAAAAFAGGVVAAGDRRPAWRTAGLMTLLGATSAVILLLAAASVTNVYADYGAAALPLVFLGAGVLVERGAEGFAGRGRFIFVATASLLLLAGLLPSTLSHLADGSRFDYRPALRRVTAETPQGAVAAGAEILVREYAPGLRRYPLRADTTRMESLLEREPDLWVMLGVKRHGIVGDDGGALGEWVVRNCRFLEADVAHRLDYRMYRMELWRCGERRVGGLAGGGSR